MDIDLDTFLVTVYCTVDDLYREHFAPHKPTRRGQKPTLSDSEVLTLALLAQWQSRRSERAFVRYARNHWRGYFPRLLSQSAFNRRVRDLWGVLCGLGPTLSQRVAALVGPAAYTVLDGIAVPLMHCCRGKRHRLFGADAAIGCGGSDHDWYYGVKLVAALNATGPIGGFVFGPANTEERWLAEALLRWRHDPFAPPPTAADLAPVLGPSHRTGGQRIGPTGQVQPRLGVGTAEASPYISDGGLAGQDWQHHWALDYRAAVLTRADSTALACPDDQRAAARWLSGLRQHVETAFNLLTDQFGLRFPRARTPWGLVTRVAAKIAAFDVLIYVNHLFGRPTFASFDPLG